MRKLGQTVNARDERGWMVPRDGTLRRRVYDLLVQGKSISEICGVLGMNVMTCKTHQRNIVKSARQNAIRYNSTHEVKVAVPQ